MAYHLAIPVKDLLKINSQLPVAFAPAGSQVIIWRSRGQLLGNKQ
jgi:hypothetical protein